MAQPRSRPKRAPKKPNPVDALTVEKIVHAGLAFGLRDGFEALTMRSLSRELGVTPMAIYYHVGDRDTLFSLMLDAVLSPVEVPSADEGNWETRLRLLDRRSAEALEPWRGIVSVMNGQQPSREGWRLIDGYVSMLLDAGFDEQEAAYAFAMLQSHGLGHAAIERRLNPSLLGPSELTEASPNPDSVLRLEPYLSDSQRPGHRASGFDFILSGLKARLAAS